MAQASIAASSRLLGRDDLQRDRERHIAVERCGHRVLTSGLDVIDVDLLAIDVDLGLSLDRIHDVSRGDRTEQLAFGARLAFILSL